MTALAKDHCRRLSCPACGVFGLRARRRARRHDEAALIRFHVHLADQARAERRATLAAITRGMQPWQVEAMIAALERDRL